MKKTIRANIFLLFGLLASICGTAVASGSPGCSQTPTLPETAASTSVAAASLSRSTNQTRSRPVATGNWGAPGVRLVVERRGVKIEYDCANGEINRQLKADKHGNFKVDGFHKRGTFGPIRIGHEPKNEPARYEGTVTGKIMKFKVTLIETNETIGEFTVTRGTDGKIRRCY